MEQQQAFENPSFSHTHSIIRAERVQQKRVARVMKSGHHDRGLNQAKGGDPMSSEIRAGGSDFGYEVISTRQPSAK